MKQRIEVVPCETVRYRTLVEAPFHQRHEQLCWLRDDTRTATKPEDGFLVSATAHCTFGRDDGDMTRLGGGTGGLRAGLDNTDDRHAVDMRADRGQADR